jgi:hypothetical protein
MNTSKVSSMFTLSFQLLMAGIETLRHLMTRGFISQGMLSALLKMTPLCPESSSRSASDHWFRPFVLIELPDELHPGGTEKLRTLWGQAG